MEFTIQTSGCDEKPYRAKTSLGANSMTRRTDTDWLTPVVRLLEANIGRTIPFDRIAAVAGMRPTSDLENGIAVRICHARKELPDLHIEKVRSVGYRVEEAQ